jgi:hypothetical protein
MLERRLNRRAVAYGRPVKVTLDKQSALLVWNVVNLAAWTTQ